MSLAGVEMVIALIVVIVILTAALFGSCWKLRKLQNARREESSRPAPAPSAQLSSALNRAGGGDRRPTWPEQEPLNQSSP